MSIHARRILEHPDTVRLGTFADAQGKRMVFATVYVIPNGYGVVMVPNQHEGDLGDAIRRANRDVWGDRSPKAIFDDLYKRARAMHERREVKHGQGEPARRPEKAKSRIARVPAQGALRY